MITREGGDFFETSWRDAWASPVYRAKFLTGSVLFIALLMVYPYFFTYIQGKEGVYVNDLILDILPATNMSLFIFSIIYFSVIWAIYRSLQSPSLFLLYLWGSLFVGLSRIITILLVPLNPPVNLIQLVDPILALFYRHNNITKDLFYSGHTGSVFLVYLILRKKKEKTVVLIATIVLGVLLLIQHIHYFIDVVFAPAFVYLVFLFAKRVTNYSSGNYS